MKTLKNTTINQQPKKLHESALLRKRFDQVDKRRRRKAFLRNIVISAITIISIGLIASLFDYTPPPTNKEDITIIKKQPIDNSKEQDSINNHRTDEQKDTMGESKPGKASPIKIQDKITPPPPKAPVPNLKDKNQPTQKKRVFALNGKIAPQTFGASNKKKSVFFIHLDTSKHLQISPMIQVALIDTNYVKAKKLIREAIENQPTNQELVFFDLVIDLLSEPRINRIVMLDKLSLLENNISLQNEIIWCKAYLNLLSKNKKESLKLINQLEAISYYPEGVKKLKGILKAN